MVQERTIEPRKPYLAPACVVGRWASLVLAAECLMLAGCWSSSDSNRVVVYVALDQPFSEPILKQFGEKAHLEVDPVFDAESTKTVGLTSRLIQESQRPRCDVFWNNEIVNTLRLEKKGLLDVYRSPAAAQFPAIFRSANGTWHGFAARARILLVNTDLVAEADRPSSIRDLADSKWRGKAGLAKPLFGTTATHAACLFAAWGEDKAREYFDAVKANDVKIMSGNKQVAQAVGSGQLLFGLTDTDDAMVEIEAARPVAIVYPDQGEEGLGTLFIPNTLAIIKGCPHPQAARQLVDYLLSPAVEEQLARGESAQIPLNPAVEIVPRVETPKTIKPMEADFAAAVDEWDTVAAYLRDAFADAN